MARAIIGGLKQNGFAMETITVLEPDATKRHALNQEFQVNTCSDYSHFNACEIVVLAVKPQQLKMVCESLLPYLQSQLIISIAAGVKIQAISRWLKHYTSIVRVMPNTPAQIQAGVSALCAFPEVNSEQRQQAETILTAVGKTLWLDEESKMDAVTAISGSGPAYVFYLIEALQEAAEALGLDQNAAELLALETFAGASLLAKYSHEDVKTLRAQVTSKGGTTEQGILALEIGDIKTTIRKAAQAAAEKSVKLGEQLSD